MADPASSQEKTEDATPKRLREARKKGQTAKSRDLNTVVILIAAFVMVGVSFNSLGDQIRSLLEGAIAMVQRKDFQIEELLQFGNVVANKYFVMILPYLGVVAGVALLVGFFQVGPIFSFEPVKFQSKRLNVVENVKNMAKVTTLVELFKNILKITVIFYIAYWVVKDHLREVVMTVTTDLPQSVQVAGVLTTSFIVLIFVIFIAVAILDVMVQRWNYKKQLRMTKEEVKREYKQDEGDPLIRSARRQLHQELAMGDVRQAVSVSDVVVTNTTELAIAVKYDDKEMMSPQVMIKGERLFAQTIRTVAEELKIPVVRNVPLAWSLIELEVGDEIPEDLYAAMAEVLVVIYRMRKEN